MNNEQILKGRLMDLAKRAYTQNIYTYSNFLSLEELGIVYEMAEELSYIPMEANGGYESAQRQIIGFGSEEIFGYPGEFPISVIKITPLMEKFSDTLSHRDYLGSIMNLGIERDTLGDILIKDKTAYLICLNSIAEYIMENLTKIKHTNVKCEITSSDIPELKPTFREENFPVASLRLDGIIAQLTKCSRKETLSFFTDKKVTLNGKITGRNSITLKEGDVFSVRGYGKFIFEGAGGNTKKGKIYVHIKRYV